VSDVRNLRSLPDLLLMEVRGTAKALRKARRKGDEFLGHVLLLLLNQHNADCRVNFTVWLALH
jgi:hypothetical protein